MSKHKSIQRPGYLSTVARNGSLEMYNVQIELLITTNASRNKKLMFNCSFVSNSPCGFLLGTNLVLGPPEIFFRRNPSGTFRDVHWYHLGDLTKVPGAPSQGFLIFFRF